VEEAGVSIANGTKQAIAFLAVQNVSFEEHVPTVTEVPSGGPSREERMEASHRVPWREWPWKFEWSVAHSGRSNGVVPVNDLPISSDDFRELARHVGFSRGRDAGQDSELHLGSNGPGRIT
jgi:hypothetical protein